MTEDKYKNMYATSREVRFESMTVAPQRSAWNVAWGFFSKTFNLVADYFIKFTSVIGMVVDYGINAISKLISIKIGILDTSKVHLCEEINQLKGELAEAKLRNKRLDSENYLLYNALHDLEVGGNMCYDKCVQWFGSDCEQAVRWRDALAKSNASRGFIVDEASEYHVARMNHEWMKQYEKKEDGEHRVRPSSKRKRKR